MKQWQRLLNELILKKKEGEGDVGCGFNFEKVYTSCTHLAPVHGDVDGEGKQ